MKFSERMGFVEPRRMLQTNDMDSKLRNKIWDITYLAYKIYSSSDVLDFFTRKMWGDFFNGTADTCPLNSIYSDFDSNFTPTAPSLIKPKLLNEWKFHTVYDFIEYLVICIEAPHKDTISKALNNALEQEMSGYRIVNNQVTPITSEQEIEAIEEAAHTNNNLIKEHLQKALKYLSDRIKPDYRNSIKESISAVESLIRQKTDRNKFSDALTEIEKTYPIHKSLKSSFASLYGYTSDENGIRHALTDEKRTVTFEEAKLLLVTCSAFINFLNGIMK